MLKSKTARSTWTQDTYSSFKCQQKSHTERVESSSQRGRCNTCTQIPPRSPPPFFVAIRCMQGQKRDNTRALCTSFHRSENDVIPAPLAKSGGREGKAKNFNKRAEFRFHVTLVWSICHGSVRKRLSLLVCFSSMLLLLRLYESAAKSLKSTLVQELHKMSHYKISNLLNSNPNQWSWPN